MNTLDNQKSEPISMHCTASNVVTDGQPPVLICNGSELRGDATPITSSREVSALLLEDAHGKYGVVAARSV